MARPLQGSLFDQPGPLELGPLDGVRRTPLTGGAWIDVLPGWLSGADTLFGRLADIVPWHAERRQMYDRMVDVPRLLKFYGEDEPLPDPILARARDMLSDYYRDDPGGPIRTVGLCYYRDGRDSVAWHGDRNGRGNAEDTIVAILSVGAARPLLLRPRGGGEVLRHLVGHGDLIVMGGSCQRTWDHAIPKIAKAIGPRISIQFRQRGVS